ncbi:hypothetical protein [Oceanidesulfovibrio marinus]|uniref:hypothetical protein n=1 Tax=Oceanidesulfovibrio marinus TaxID=370038 RepID=UPI0011829BCD|nr:hypothetical protein [Oceanidesulfovibrio marinus]
MIIKLLCKAAFILIIMQPQSAFAKTETVCIVRPGAVISKDEQTLNKIYSMSGENVYAWYLKTLLNNAQYKTNGAEADFIKGVIKRREAFFLQNGENMLSLPVFLGDDESENNVQILWGLDYWWARKKDVTCKEFKY